MCCVCSLKYLYQENTIKLVILRIQYCKVYETNQIRLNNNNNNNNNNKLHGPVTQSGAVDAAGSSHFF